MRSGREQDKTTEGFLAALGMTAKGKRRKADPSRALGMTTIREDDNGKRRGSKIRARIFCGKKTPEKACAFTSLTGESSSCW